MRVGLIVQGLAGAVTGVERYMIELTQAMTSLLPNEVDVMLLTTEPVDRVGLSLPVEQLLPAGKARRVSRPVADVLARTVGRRMTTIAFGSATLPRVARRERLDIVHDLTALAPIALGTGPAASVVSVHDLISHIELRSNDLIDTLVQKYWLPHVLRRADAVIGISQATCVDVERYLGIDPLRQHVVPLGVSSEFRPVDSSEFEPLLRMYGIRPPYLLAIGANAPRKNLSRLVEAFRVVRRRNPDLSLVVTGESTRDGEPAGGDQDGVFSLGYVAQEHLPALYSAATVFAFPSLYEGFGLPVLEAMACGTPTLCGDNSSLPEVASDAAFLVDATSVDAIADGLDRLITDPALRQLLTERGLARAACFSWKSTAERTIAVYRSVAGVTR